MKRWKIWQISLFVILCILLNYVGREFASYMELPMWMDSFGTVLSAYMGGPVVGIIVGVTINVIYGTVTQVSFVYAMISIVLAVIVGYAAEKDMFRSFFGTMTVSSAAALCVTAISVPLDLVYAGGMTGNLWGNGVLLFLQERNVPHILCLLAGEFCVDFVDKVLTLLLLYVLIRLLHLKGKRQEEGRAVEEGGAAALPVIFLLLGASVLMGGGKAAEAAAVDQADKALAAVEMTTDSDVAGEAGTGGASLQDEEEEETNYNDYVQTIYSNTNGLACGEANDIAQTNDGILWIGTYAGLYRYNGSEFYSVNYDSVRNVNCLYVDDEGRLWVGTNDNGLSICINGRVANVLDQRDGLPSNSVRSITRSSDGYYYVGTTGSMQILTLSGGLKRAGTLREIYFADKISADKDGHVAAITSDGRLFLLKEGRIQSSMRLTSGREIYRCCGFDEEGRLFVGTSSNTVYIYDVSGGSFEEKDQLVCEGLNNLNDIYFRKNGEIFFSADNGIGYFTRSGNYYQIHINDFNNSIDNMLVDYQDNLWFTSSRLGLLRLSSTIFTDLYSTVGMEEKVVNSVTKWLGSYYIGTDAGLDIIDGSRKKQIKNELTEELASARIRCIFTDSARHLWVCTYGQGLVEVEPGGSTYYYNQYNGSFGNRARLVTELSDGTIVAAGDTGMSFIRSHKILRTIGYADGLINSMILTVVEMDDGTVLAGTDGDGIAVIADKEVQRMLTVSDGLSSGVILRMVRDPKTGGMFIVTSNGLCYMDESGQIRQLSHFPYSNNYDIWFRDDDTMFVTGSAGIHVVKRDELLKDEEELSYELLDFRKGLTSALTANSWNYSDEEGNLFLSCDKGVYVVNSENYSGDKRSYRMSISSIFLDGVHHEVERGEDIVVDRSVDRIELYPEVINYTIQDPYVGYYLEGYEKDWIVLPQSSMDKIAYTHLPTGEYSFHLAVFDSNKENILEQRKYTLIKESAIYDNRWFHVYMLIVAVVAAGWFAAFVAKTQAQRVMERQQRELAIADEKIRMGNETIAAIAKAVDAKDVRTSQHSQRVSQYSEMIGRELGLDEKECENLRRAALTHDIGKIGIPDSILNKPARLTDDEYAVMKSHTVRGAEILKDFTLIDHVVEGAQFHHERYDGRGYPAGLEGEEIPLYGRIIGVADAFDAMTANRVYRKQCDFGYVLNELKKGRGTQFDPQMVDIFLRIIDEGKIDLNNLYPQAAEEAKPEEKKAEEKKTEEKKVEGEKPEELKAEEKKPEKVKADEKRPEQVKPEEKKAEEVKPEEKKAEEVKPEEKKPEERKAEAKRPEPEEIKTEEKKTDQEKADQEKAKEKGGA